MRSGQYRAMKTLPVIDSYLEPPPDLIGRGGSLECLDEWFQDRATASRVRVVHGPAGVGKSGLLATWMPRIHQQAAASVLSSNLGGFAPPGARRTIDDAVADWLRALGVARPPADIEARREILGEILSRHPAVLVLDNVSSEDDVHPLINELPRAIRFVIVSRLPLSGLRVTHHSSGQEILPLSKDDAATLLQRRSPRLAHHRGLALEMTPYCAGLPLALTVAAAVVEDEPTTPIGALLTQLSEAYRALATLSTFEDQLANVRAALSWSYDRLPTDEARRAFRLTGLHPAQGSGATVHTLAALLDRSTGSTEEILGVLVKHRLLARRYASDVDVTARYFRHDLLSSYAHELASSPEHAEEGAEGVRRLANVYADAVNYAFDRLNHENPMVDTERRDKFRSSDQLGCSMVDAGPLRWFEAERANIASLIVELVDQGQQVNLSLQLACSPFYLLEISRQFATWDLMEEAVGSFAGAPGIDELEWARYLRNRGRRFLVDIIEAHERLRMDGAPPNIQSEVYVKVEGLLRESLKLYRTVGKSSDPRRRRSATMGQITVARELADALRLVVASDNPRGISIESVIETYEGARKMFEGEPGLSDQTRQNFRASLDLALALAQISAGRYELAERHIIESLEYAGGGVGSSVAHPRLQAFAYRRLGDLYRLYGGAKYDAGISSLLRASGIFRNPLGDLVNYARALAIAGRMQLEIGEKDEGGNNLRNSYDALTECNEVEEAVVVQTWAANAGVALL